MLLRRSKTQARVQESVDRDGRQLLVDFDGASDELLHDFVGSAVDARHPGVRELPSDRVLPHESGAAMQLVNKETKAKRKKWIKKGKTLSCSTLFEYVSQSRIQAKVDFDDLAYVRDGPWHLFC